MGVFRTSSCALGLCAWGSIRQSPVLIQGRCKVSEIISFGAPAFIPAFASTFLLTAMEEKCLGPEGAGDSYLAGAFIGQGRMGSHSDVFVLQPKKKLLLHFTWFHPGRCPLSVPLPIFCPSCFVYLPWGKPYIHPEHTEVTNTCKACGHARRTQRGEGMQKWTKGRALSKSPEGDWFMTSKPLISHKGWFQDYQPLQPPPPLPSAEFHSM